MAGRNDGPSNLNPEALYIAVFVLTVLVCFLIWTYARPLVVLPLYALQWVQIKLIQLTMGLQSEGRSYLAYVESYFNGINDARFTSWADLSQLKWRVGRIMALPFALLVCGMAALVIFRMPGNGMKRAFSLAGGKGEGPSLMRYQAQYWEPLKVSEGFNPDAPDPMMDQARTPAEWLRDNDVPVENGKVDRDRCKDAFKEQLGDPWQGVRSCSVPVQCLLVIMGLHAAGASGKSQAELARRVRYEISSVFVGHRDKVKRKEALAAAIAPHLANADLVKRLEEIGKKHAYVSTAMIAMLSWCRNKAGVLASAEFLWLKTVDRSLWYAMNNVGRRSFHIEGGGPINHFFAERVAQNALLTPRLEECVDGVDAYLNDQGILSLEEFFERPED